VNYEARAVERIKSILKQRGMKHKFIAQQCGYTEKQFSDILYGRKRLYIDDAVNICEALGVGLDAITADIPDKSEVKT
jgi:transcriptional regulator with XRE-family HTH domain